MEYKTYIIWQNNSETPNLIKKLTNRNDGVITVIDPQAKGLRKFDDYVLATEEYVQALQGIGMNLIHFQYMMDTQEWREGSNEQLYGGGLLH